MPVRKKFVRSESVCSRRPAWLCPLINRALIVGSLALSLLNAASQTTTTIDFNYTNRAALLAGGWDFMARTPSGAGRDTETSTGVTPPDVSYDQTLHPGVLQIPASAGDLWAAANDTRNSVFRELPSNWSSVRLEVGFAPTQPYQQVHLVIYQDDDNYVEMGRVYGYPTNQIVGFVRESK